MKNKIKQRLDQLLQEFNQALEQEKTWHIRSLELKGAIIEFKKLLEMEIPNVTKQD